MTVTLRADGSSRFAKGHKWGYFPSGGLAWRINQEDFLKDVNFLDNLKLRTSYGIVGNQEISSYQSMAQVDATSSRYTDYVFRYTGEWIPYLYIGTAGSDLGEITPV